jgi:hypothetical protein
MRKLHNVDLLRGMVFVVQQVLNHGYIGFKEVHRSVFHCVYITPLQLTLPSTRKQLRPSSVPRRDTAMGRVLEILDSPRSVATELQLSFPRINSVLRRGSWRFGR